MFRSSARADIEHEPVEKGTTYVLEVVSVTSAEMVGVSVISDTSGTPSLNIRLLESPFTGCASKDALKAGGDSGRPGRLPVFESKRDREHHEKMSWTTSSLVQSCAGWSIY